MRVSHHDVAIIGAGFGGLGLAIRLKQNGFDDFVVLERGNEVGGTWRDNTYPGAACDVPSNLYSFSFCPNPHWSRSFSPQSEIQQYLVECADRFGVRPHIRFGHEVLFTSWDNEAARWQVETAQGEYTARVLVGARGPLSEPHIPDLPGLEEFEGTTFHSAQWDHDHDLRGRRVGVIGTGASAVQFVPKIQPYVERLSVFQRTPPWILPRADRAFTRLEHTAFRALPAIQLAARATIYWGRELYALGFTAPPRVRDRLMRLPEKIALAQLKAQVKDPELRKSLTPAYEMGCKRVVISSDYYPTLEAQNVDVVTSSITEVRPDGVVTADGETHPVDTLIFGTGFDVITNAATTHTKGRDGQLLADAWHEGVSAYKGTTITGFPNLFLLVGPNSGLGHTSIVFIIESQIAYILGALKAMQRSRTTAIDVRSDVQQRWNEGLQGRSRQTVWTSGGCTSYYLDERGRNVALWPGFSWGFRRALRRFDISDYVQIEPAGEAGPALTRPRGAGPP